MTQIVRHHQAIQRRYNASDIQAPLTQQEAKDLMIRQLAGEIARQMPHAPVQPQQHIHYHVHESVPDSGLKEAVMAFVLFSCIGLGLFATCGAIYQGLKSEVPTVSKVA